MMSQTATSHQGFSYSHHSRLPREVALFPHPSPSFFPVGHASAKSLLQCTFDCSTKPIQLTKTPESKLVLARKQAELDYYVIKQALGLVQDREEDELKCTAEGRNTEEV